MYKKINNKCNNSLFKWCVNEIYVSQMLEKCFHCSTGTSLSCVVALASRMRESGLFHVQCSASVYVCVCVSV